MKQSTARTAPDPADPWHAGGLDDLVELDPEHPGFRDRAYRDRRNTIARIALDYAGGAVPDAPYTDGEHQVWRDVWSELEALHRDWAAPELVDLARQLGLGRERIPQLRDVNDTLRAATGFEMQPVAGLVNARTFLGYLGRRVFLSTQYIRHASMPRYTPEPDIVHELVGHAATLTHPGIAELSRAFGLAATVGDDARVAALERVYWYTLEYGAIASPDGVRAVGAGLLSSFGEIQSFAERAELLPWNLDRMAATDYDPTDYQTLIFVAPSFDRMLADVRAWIER